MSNSEGTSALISEKLETYLSTPEEPISCGEIKEQDMSTEALAGDAGSVIWIKTEPVDPAESQFSGQSNCDLDMTAEETKDEENVFDISPHPSTSFQFSNRRVWPCKVKQDPEFLLKEAGVGEYFCFYCQLACKSLLRLKKHIRSNHSTLYRSETYNEENLKTFVPSEGSHAPCDNIKESLESFSSYCEPTSPTEIKDAFSINMNGHTIFSQTKENRFIKRHNISQLEKPHSCPQCDYKTRHSGILKRHILVKHSNEKPYSCSQCDYRTALNETLKKHIIAKHTNEKPYSCPQCDYKATQNGHLKSHIAAKHNKERPFSCLECDYMAAESGHLKRHIIAKHTNEKPKSCPHCDYTTTQNGTLKTHILTKHTLEKPYSCTQCDYTTADTGNLKSHIMAKHAKEKPYSCNFCEYRSTWNRDLKYHIMTKHCKEKPYPCPLCNYRAAKCGHLKSHILSKHTNEKPYSCNQCDYTATHKGQLNRHIITKHSNDKPQIQMHSE